MKKNIILIISTGILFIICIFFLIYLLLPPKLSLKGKTSVVINYNKEYKEEGYKASLFGEDTSNNVIINNNVNYNKVGVYYIEYTSYDKLNLFKNTAKRKIEVVDREKPLIELIGENVTLYVGEEYNELGYKAIDNCDGDITDKVNVLENIDTSEVGRYYVKYNVKDSSSNEFEILRTVNVIPKKGIYSSVQDSVSDIDSIPVITYHALMQAEEKSRYAQGEKYTMSTEKFENQLKYLKENGYNTISIDDFYKWYTNQLTLTNKDILITFDDGHLSTYQYGIPLIEKYGFKATIFVITGRVSLSSLKWNPTKNQYFSEEIVKDILNNHKDITLASHTHYMHAQEDGSCALVKKSGEEIYNDLMSSRDIINSEYLAYPFGCHDDKSIEALKKAGFKMAFAFGDSKKATKNDDIYAINRININDGISMEKFINYIGGTK